MGKSRIVASVGAAAVRSALDSGFETSRDTTALAVRYLLQVLGDAAPGKTLEVRVPPFGAVQCVEGPSHTRGTPPNVIEMDVEAWLQLATGALAWPEAVESGRASASGSRATLAVLLPLKWNSDQWNSDQWNSDTMDA